MVHKMVQWAQSNKLVIFLGLLSICLCISTAVLAIQKTGNHGKDNKSWVTLVQKVERESKNNSQTLLYKSIMNNKRLSQYVIPINYKLQLIPNMEKNTFKGRVEINVNITKSTKLINLHSNLLSIKFIGMQDKNKNLSISSFETVNDDREFLNIHFQKDISVGIYKILINFEGSLKNGIFGFYGSTLKNGKTMVASKFQPTYARQAFPCFDEPDFKATYDITLVKPPSYIALSNMPEISRTHDNISNTDAVTFATSVPMSTYLACFVVCDFEAKETEINANGIGNNFILRSFAQKDQTNKIDFAQDIGKRATEFYINYYQVPFPLPKLDMIAIPDYVSGATEHWGLITYRETSFLIDDATASAANKISVANTIAHELAHMWFGNLVTMKWWDEVWLNEGFASYMQVKSLNAIEPSWTMLDQFLIKTMHSVLVTDAKLSSHPIVQTVSTPDQITAIFDSISYNKGSSVLRMLEGFVGEKNFQMGVTDYLKKYEFGNTITQNLLDALEPYFKKQNPDLSITYIMDTWTKQMGYPVLNVQNGGDPSTYTVTQKRFLLDPEAAYDNNTEFKYRWYVPVTYKTNKGINEEILWFPDTVDKVTFKVDSDIKWIKINNNQVGYYRVNYPNTVWLELTKELQSNSKQLTISDRAHLLNDVFALAEARLISYDLALNLTTYLTVEDQYVPWATASTIFNNLGDWLMNSLAYGDLRKYVQHLIKPLYAQQKWTPSPNTDVIKRLLRTRILGTAASFELPDAMSKIRSKFLNWLDGHSTDIPADIEPDLRNIVYFHGMKSASSEEWEKVWEIYLKEEDAQEQSKLRSALSAPRDTNILRRYLTLAWDESNIRGQDYLNVLAAISDNPSGTALVWDDVRARWPLYVERFTLNSRYLGNLIPSITSSFNTQLKYKEMEEFFEQYPDAGAGEAARKRALETIRNNIRWTEHNEPTVSAWLRNFHANLK